VIEVYTNHEVPLGVGFIGNYLPRKCGIATFTYDLAESVARRLEGDRVSVVAMNDRREGYEYPKRVRVQVGENRVDDYIRAARFLNDSGVHIACLQHEYGIFGKPFGINILTMLRHLQVPLVVTCHTVLEQPAPLQREIFQEILAHAVAVVVMSQRAAHFLKRVYDVTPDKVEIIPHGIHPFPYVDTDSYKARLNLTGRRLLLTFGLINPNKGIEHMVEAMPAIVAQHPEAKYVVLGRTHPAVLAEEGEAYRMGLLRRVSELGLDDHVLFHNDFVELDELLGYIAASDVCVTPYLTLDHISSGVLAYGLAMGRVCVSTPYWCAKELLADGRGRLVPPADPDALVREILGVLGDDHKAALMQRRAYSYCQHMAWPAVAASYIDLFERLRRPDPEIVPLRLRGRDIIEPPSVPL
jgi:glycosyltransferase involved in cell wall biosynthesis